VVHDMICDRCGEIVYDLPLSKEGAKCVCLGRMEIYWHQRPRNAVAFSAEETTVVYEHPVTGEVRYPARNDQPMPERYRQQGFEQRELRSLREVDRFSKEHGMINERAHYNSGNGYDQEHR